MKIALASDHAGYAEKERLKPLLLELGLEVDDLGTVSEESVDYPDYARKVADEVAQGRADQGVLVCGSGTGMAITANKVPGVRAAVAWSEETARLARQHNDANVMAIGARTTPPAEIPAIVRAWFSAEFEGGRHAERVGKIEGRRQEAVGRRQKAESRELQACLSSIERLKANDRFEKRTACRS
jgi:RpiB/LacA/LacB family sugar-phosphate isomerase